MSENLQLVAHSSSTSGPTLREVVAVFFRHQRIVKGSFAAVATAGILYALFSPSYKAEMKVLVRRGRIDPAVTSTQTASPAFEHDEISEDELNSEVELLRDGDILRKVVIDTRLDRPSWFSKLRGDNSEARTEKATRKLAGKLTVEPARKSRLITVSYASTDPGLSAKVLRALAAAYLEKHAELRRPSGQQDFFEEQMEQSRQALEQAQERLVEFGRRKGVVSAELQRDLTLQKLSEAVASDLGVQSSIAEAAERARSLETNLRALPERNVTEIRNADNPQLQEKLKSKLLELQLKRTELMTKFQPSYRLVEEVDQQIIQAKAAIEAEDLKPLRDETTAQDPEFTWARTERLKNQVDAKSLGEKHMVAQQQVLAYRAAAREFGENAIRQHDLEQTVKVAEEKYVLYSGKREEARIGDALDQRGILNVAIAEQPRAPVLPVWPLWAAASFSILGAGVFSTGLAFAADYLDPSLRTAEEVIAVLGMPVLASLPASSQPIERGRQT
jgi:uncharacterized protein involved in exopolysaccharide biosynthesis